MPDRYVEFRIGDAVPADSVLANFVTRLCIVTNDLMLQQANTEVEYSKQTGRRGGVPLYYLYATCSHFREAAKRLGEDLDNPEIAAFLEELDPDAQERLTRLKASFTPWEGSFVKERLYPLRNFTFHYPDSGVLQAALEKAADLRSGIDLGDGSYVENRYDFADEVVGQIAAGALGEDESELEKTLHRVAALIVDYVYLSHRATARYIEFHSRPTFSLREAKD